MVHGQNSHLQIKIVLFDNSRTRVISKRSSIASVGDAIQRIEAAVGDSDWGVAMKWSGAIRERD